MPVQVMGLTTTRGRPVGPIGEHQARSTCFALRDLNLAARGLIVTAAHAVSDRGVHEEYGPVERLELSCGGHCYQKLLPVPGVDFTVHPEWLSSNDSHQGLRALTGL